jgi:aspartate/methionine/tyrosine aminotransferase
MLAQVRQLCLQEFATLQDLCTIPPATGAFYFLLKAHTSLHPFHLVRQLIQDYRVAVIPGMTFGMEEGCYLRVAYGALQQDTVAEGMGRLVKGLRAIVGSGKT